MKYIIFLFFISLGTLTAQQSKVQLTYNPLLYQKDAGHFSMDSIDIEMQEKSSKKSVGKALFLSLLIPGAGEYYTENTFFTKVFLGIEVLAIGAIFMNQNVYNSRLKDSRTFAATHAGVDRSSKTDEFWRVIGKYDNIFLYNEQRKRERLTGDVFTENELYYWQWDSKKNRLKYDRKRLQAQVIKDNEIFIVTAVLVNHLVSAVNSVRLARKFNKKLAANGLSYNLVINNRDLHDKYIGLNFSKSF